MIPLFHRFYRAVRKGRANFYSDVKLSPDEIEKGHYKKFLGGGEKTWAERGKFQLFFLRQMGLVPSHGLLDVGCGPIRAGVHFIAYLDPQNYTGIDYNADFIHIAQSLVEKDAALKLKNPSLAQVEDFDFRRVNGPFDYVIAFSVLNHCDPEKKRLFFERLPNVLKPTSKIYLTHATWFYNFSLPDGRLKVTRTIDAPEQISADLRLETWGWPPTESIFPILELTPCSD